MSAQEIWMSGRLVLGAALAAWIMAGCSDKPLVLGPAPQDEPDAQSPEMDAEDQGDIVEEPDAVDTPDAVEDEEAAPLVDPTVLALPAGREVRHGAFATSELCRKCHSNSPQATAMRDDWGEDASPFDMWRASMMALSSRDPFWRAVVSAEVARTPSLGAVIEGECVKCHAPMASWDAHQSNEPVGMAVLAEDSPRGQLALDGVSCSLCHQLNPDAMGEESFSGNYEVEDEGVIYGPFADVFTRPMEQEAGYTPTQGRHMTEAGVCAPCHVLTTPTMTPEGVPTGHQFDEQLTYLEWQNSSYRVGDDAGPKARPCQHCHMPHTDALGGPITTAIARRPDGGDFPPIPERDPYRRHTFQGANVALLGVMRQWREMLAPDVPVAAFDASITRTRSWLEESTEVRVEAAALVGGVVRARVSVRHEAGHKFPTGYPSRRAWLRVRLLDQGGQVLFASGEFDALGRIVDAEGEPLSSELPDGPWQPHRLKVSAPDQVQIYEMVMGDPDGRPTQGLLRAARRVKDNRLLPEGYSASHPTTSRTAPVDVGLDDDFLNGADMVEYEIAVPSGATPARVEATLLYQTLGARFMAELFEVDTPEVAAFEMMLDEAARSPLAISTDESPVMP